MPYKNIIFIKLFLDLFDETDRFLYQLNERQQLLYIKLLYLAGRQKNKITKNSHFGISKINYQGSRQDYIGDIKRIKKIFPRFTETKYYYTFTNFEELHNRINDYEIGSSEVCPISAPGGVPKEKEKEKEKENEKEKIAKAAPTSKTETPKKTKDLMEKVNKTFPIYVFNNKVKKKLGRYLPFEVIDKACSSYLVKMEVNTIDNKWGYMVKTCSEIWKDFNRDQNTQEAQDYKKLNVSIKMLELTKNIGNLKQ